MVKMSLGVYVHYPYCARHCPYCDFNVAVTRRVPHGQYADAVCAELRVRAQDFMERPPASTVYFGGGTPGIWPAEHVARVLEAIDSSLGIADGAEISLEFNPEDATHSRIKALVDAGVNRVSLGVQSFNDGYLSVLGRRHDGAQAREAVQIARGAGVQNLSIDLIHGMMGQTLAEGLDDISVAAALGPEHISTYQLTIEEKTAFGARARRGERLLVDEERLLRFFVEIRQALSQEGFTPYEISSASRPGFESRHNTTYWTGGEYLALGAGAHGFRREGDGAVRWENERHPGRYMEAAIAGRPAVNFEDQVTADELIEDEIMTALRMDRGLRVQDRHRARCEAAARSLIADGLLEPDEEHWRVTDAGRTVLDSVILNLLS